MRREPRAVLLVHGACHGAWCWDAVTPRLQGGGRAVAAVDLPGRRPGERAGWRWSLDDYAAAVVEAAGRLGAPVVAVGHSMGGQVISAAAERAPERFAGLVYLSAFLPRDGDSIATLARHNAGSGLPEATRVSLLSARLTIRPDTAAPVFYGDVPAELAAQAVARLVPESVRPSLTRLRLTPTRFGALPRAFIRLSQDRVLTPAQQDWMLGRQACARVETLESSHSPFLSRPEELADLIGDLANA